MINIARQPTARVATFSLLLAGAIVALNPDPAMAKDPLFNAPWTFKVHNNPVALGRAVAVQQMKHGTLGGAGGSSGRAAGGGGIMVPNVAANYSVITVLMGDGAVGDIDIGTHQDSIGDQTAESTSAVSLDGDATVGIQP